MIERPEVAGPMPRAIVGAVRKNLIKGDAAPNSFGLRSHLLLQLSKGNLAWRRLATACQQ